MVSAALQVVLSLQWRAVDQEAFSVDSSIMNILRIGTGLAPIFGILDAVRNIILDWGLKGETLLREAGTPQHSLVSTL